MMCLASGVGLGFSSNKMKNTSTGAAEGSHGLRLQFQLGTRLTFAESSILLGYRHLSAGGQMLKSMVGTISSI